MKALVVAGGEITAGDGLSAAMRGRDRPIVVAADGGLHNADTLGLPVDVVVGDGDSLAPATIDGLVERGIQFQRHPVEKDATDTELALREAIARGAQDITMFGALGGLRFDHALANVLLLANTELAAGLSIVDGPATVRVLDGERVRALEIAGTAGDVVTLLALDAEVIGVRLAGLRYGLDGATLRRGSTLGLSNTLTGTKARVEIEAGCLAVVHVRQGGPA